MNTNEISPRTNPQMKRIRVISRIIKVLLLIYVFATGLIEALLHTSSHLWRIFGMPFSKFADIPAGLKLLSALAVGVFLLAVVTIYRLVNLYERGTVFSLTNVQLYKRLDYWRAFCGDDFLNHERGLQIA